MRFAIKNKDSQPVKADREYLPTDPQEDPYYHDSGELFINIGDFYVQFNHDGELDQKTLDSELNFDDYDPELVDQEFDEPILLGFEAKDIAEDEVYKALYEYVDDPVPGSMYSFKGSITVPYSMWVLEKWARGIDTKTDERYPIIDQESINVDVDHIENNIVVEEVQE